jgi:hypothetical protein
MYHEMIIEAAHAAQSSGGSMTLPTTWLLVAAGAYCVMHRGTDWPGILIGVAIGVYGADGWIGSMFHGLVGGISQGLSSMGH